MKTVETPDSSNIAKLEYDGKEQALYVYFKKGGVYKYKSVPPEVFSMISQSESVGSAFFRVIRSSNYEYEKIGGNTDSMRV